MSITAFYKEEFKRLIKVFHIKVNQLLSRKYVSAIFIIYSLLFDITEFLIETKKGFSTNVIKKFH